MFREVEAAIAVLKITCRNGTDPIQDIVEWVFKWTHSKMPLGRAVYLHNMGTAQQYAITQYTTAALWLLWHVFWGM